MIQPKKQMKFNTVVLYDIENLLKGYGFKDEFAKKFSLKDINEKIANINGIEKIGIQRAYANWSNYRLNFMSNDITKYGIDPVQVFGFGRGASKNAADFHLVIDAVELCLTRPYIEVFIIVSGDGGFAALGKKLHEYGKTVIGCAYKGTTADVFKSVCDDFICLPDPDSEIQKAELKEKRLTERREKRGTKTKVIQKADAPVKNQKKKRNGNGNAAAKPKENTSVSNPLTDQMLEKITPVPLTATLEDKLAKINMIIYWVSKNEELGKEMRVKGIGPSMLKTMFRAVLNGDVNTSHVGYLKFTNFLRFACANTPLAVYKNNNTNASRIGFRHEPIKNYTLQPDAKRYDIHSANGYRKILKTDKPIFKLPADKFLLWDVIEELVNGQHKSKSLEALIRDVGKAFPKVSAEEVKGVLFILITAECFDRTPLDVPLAKQSLKLKSEFQTEHSILNHLKLLFFEKITSVTQQNLKSEVLMQLI